MCMKCCAAALEEKKMYLLKANYFLEWTYHSVNKDILKLNLNIVSVDRGPKQVFVLATQRYEVSILTILIVIEKKMENQVLTLSNGSMKTMSYSIIM